MAVIPPADVVEILSANAETEKRASWEAFEFRILGGGEVEVVNGSYERPDDHTYTVHVEGGIPAYCTCPSWEYQVGACKHMVAVAIREPVLEAANAPTAKADGGTVLKLYTNGEEDETECDCDSFPCWECYRDGRRDLPEGEE